MPAKKKSKDTIEIAEKHKGKLLQLTKDRVAYETKYEADLEKDIVSFRKKTPDVFGKAKRGKKPRTILAEGDSWMKYCVGHAVAWHLTKLDRRRNHLMNIGSPSDTAAEILNGGSAKRLARELKRGPARNRKYDVLIFSAGGNDILDKSVFRTFLNDYASGMTAKDVINKSMLNAAFKMLFANYDRLFSIRDKNSPDTLIYMNQYDYAQPGIGGIFPYRRGTRYRIGPWLEPGLDDAGVPKAMWGDVVVELLKYYKSRLKSHIKKNGVTKLVLIETQGALAASDWDNEIHPTFQGFKKVAQLFQKQLDTDFP